MSAYVTFLLYFYYDSWDKHCVKEISIWMSVFLLILFLHMVRSTAIICLWVKSRDPALDQIKVELFYGSCVFLFEAGWCIYGSCFIYSEKMQRCKDDMIEDKYATMLWISALVCICLGYVLILYLIGICCFGCITCLVIK